MNVSTKFQEHNEWFKTTTALFYTIIAHCSLTLYSIGLFANGATLYVFRGKLFRTANFIPYKIIAALELCFCVNGIVLALLTEIEESPSFISAYLFAYVNPPVISVVEYAGWYIMLIMTFERYLAICHAPLYREKRRLLTSGSYAAAISFFILFALTVNSWSAFVAFKVVTDELGNTTAYSPIPRAYDRGAIAVKNYYNGAIKAVLLIAMAYLTIRMVHRLYKRKQNASRLRSRVLTERSNEEGHIVVSAIPRLKNGRMVIMLLVIFVSAIIRVSLSETNRIVHLIWPRWWVMEELSDPEEVMRRESLFIYAHCVLYLFSAVSLVFDRSFKFFLYIMFSSQFRVCVVKKLRKPFGSPVGHPL